MSRLSRVAVAALLAALCLHHLGKGFYYLAVQHPASGIEDFRHVRVWSDYFLDRVSPQSQNFLYWSRTDPAEAAWAVGADLASSHGDVFTSGVPPWAFPLELVAFIPGPERAARVYFAVLNLAALGLLVWIADRVAWRGRGDPLARALTALSILAIGANNAALTQGQNGLLVNVGLAAALAAIDQPSSAGWAMAAGAGLAFAMIKPSSSLLFLLPLVGGRRWRALIVTAVILIAATLFGSWWVHVPLATQFAQFERATLVVIGQGVNVPMRVILAIVQSPAIARNVMGLAGLAVAIAAAVRLAPRDPLTLFGVLAVIARLFTYHRAHDDVLLAFLMIALSRRAFAAGGSPRWQWLWAATGLSLWLPYSIYVAPPAQVYQVILWIAACGAIWRAAKVWCERGDSNPHGCEPPDPKSGASANSATFAGRISE